jgi:hypothetical protein
VTWKLTIAGNRLAMHGGSASLRPKLFFTGTISRQTVNDCVARESAKGLDEEMKIVTALSPMLGAARAQMVATHVVLGVPELCKLQEPGGSSQASRARD